jgi:hypothetical protein
MESRVERLRANSDALAMVVRLAGELRRTNPAKWRVTLTEWQGAVQAILAAPVPHHDDPAAVVDAMCKAQSAGLRLGNSGEARFRSASVGRHPDSSLDGRRFYDDLDSAGQCLVELHDLIWGQTR